MVIGRYSSRSSREPEVIGGAFSVAPSFEGALCIGQHALFDVYDDESGSSPSAQIAEAKKVCARCPARLECLSDALQNDNHGIWGGTTYLERQKIKRKARRQRG